MNVRLLIPSVLSVVVVAAATLRIASPEPPEAEAVGPGESASTQQSAQSGGTRRIWAERPDAPTPVDALGGPSPDDRLLSFVDWSTGDLAVRDLVSGTNRRITGKSGWDKSDAFALYSIFSPDGRSIAYTWFTERAEFTELRVMDLATSAWRTLLRVHGTVDYLQPTDWTADGRFVVMTGQKDGAGQIALVPVDSSGARVIKSFPDWRFPSTARLSPDGRFLAYDYPPRKDDGRREVYLLPLEGGAESIVAAHAADDQVIGWTADGSRLVFGSDRGGSPSVWAARIDGGRVRGEPALIRKDLWRADRITLSLRGSLFYTVQTGDLDVYLASFDAASGQLRSQQTSLTQRPGYRYSSPAWSPDSRYIAYVTALSSGTNVVGSFGVTIRSVESGESRQLRPNLSYVAGIVWTPDAKGIVMRARDDKGRHALMRLDLNSGEVRPLVESTRSVPALSHDGRWIYYSPGFEGASEPAEWKSRVVARNLETGEERDVYVAQNVYRVGPVGRIALSPDGNQIAFIARDALDKPHAMIVDVTGKNARPAILPEHEPPFVGIVQFSPDGKYLMYAAPSQFPRASQQALWRVPLAGGKPEMLLAGVQEQHVRVSPDGRRIAFASGQIASELWVLEDPALGFEPRSAASRR